MVAADVVRMWFVQEKRGFPSLPLPPFLSNWMARVASGMKTGFC